MFNFLDSSVCHITFHADIRALVIGKFTICLLYVLSQFCFPMLKMKEAEMQNSPFDPLHMLDQNLAGPSTVDVIVALFLVFVLFTFSHCFGNQPNIDRQIGPFSFVFRFFLLFILHILEMNVLYVTQNNLCSQNSVHFLIE